MTIQSRQADEQHQAAVRSENDRQRIAALEEELVGVKERLRVIEEAFRETADFNRLLMDVQKSLLSS
jgi:hypothetical protein